MDFDWKKPLITGAVAFCVAMVAGIFGRVGFGVILFRSFLGGVVFAALAVGVDQIARKYLPELYATSTASGETVSDTESESTGNVDITLDEENPHEAVEYAATLNRTVDDGTVSAEGDDIAAFAAADDADEVVPAGPDVSDGALPSFDGVESTFVTAGSQSDDGDDDEPDIVDGSGSMSSGRSGVEILGEEQDPATVARAVRTLLNRDEKG